VQQKNFWLIADLPFTYIHEGDRYLVLADALRTMLGQKVNCSPKAFLRLEDISPENEVGLLEPLFSLLVEEHVYFNLAVIPFYVDGPEQIRLTWQDNPQSLAAITNIAKHGWAAIWQHGTTHQSDAYLNPDGVSAIDWEFWDSQSFKPLENLDASKAIQRVIMGKQALYDLGFSPVGWVTPHYAAPPDYLRTFNQTYSMFFERRFIQSGQLQTTQFFPYPVEDSLGSLVLPENTGYLDGQQSLHDMLEIARLNRALQCPYLGLFIHPFVFRPDYKGNEATSLEELRTFLRDLRQLGYSFSIPETAESINP
jgi:hypothetical protein